MRRALPSLLVAFAHARGVQVTLVPGGVINCTQQATVESGSLVTVDYRGSIDQTSASGSRGQVFDSGSFSFVVGRQSVIRAWDEGFLGLCKGDRAILVCPPETAYGNVATGPIPGGATLRFDVTVLDVEPPGLRCLPGCLLPLNSG